MKKLSRDEVEELYDVRTHGIYKGHTVAVRDKDNNRYCIETSGSDNNFWGRGFEVVDRGVYRKWVRKSELEKVWEEKTAR